MERLLGVLAGRVRAREELVRGVILTIIFGASVGREYAQQVLQAVEEREIVLS